MKSRRTVHRSEPAAAPGRRRIGFGTHAAFSEYDGAGTFITTNLVGVVIGERQAK